MVSSEKKYFYITTTLPYVNADPHIGFALEIVQADAIARFHRGRGCQVIFNTGTDEHGLKIYRRALEEKKNPQKYVDELAPRFERLKSALNLSYTHFIRTSDPRHKKAAQEFWRRCMANGDIYEAEYEAKYCVGCELEKTDSELENGTCPVHPNVPLELIKEKNYFFRFSKYQGHLLEFYGKNPDFVLPESRFHEIKNFVSSGLRDFSISRKAEKMPWGVPVPDDPAQVMYVWFDALVNYISTLGWPEDDKSFKSFWPGMQIAGKDNLRQQSAMWQAMLMSAGLPNSKQIFIHGFVTADGQKMSKSLGNVVDPVALVEKYGTDPVRYYLLREIPSGEDGDFSYAKFEERYNGELANGLGNLVARVATLGEKVSPISQPFSVDNEIKNICKAAQDIYLADLGDIRLHDALGTIWTLISHADKYINDNKPWTIKEREKLTPIICNSSYIIDIIRKLLEPFLPESAEKIKEQIKISDDKIEIKKCGNLFPRIM